MPNRWNQYNFSTLYLLFIWGYRWILVQLLIFVDWYQHSNTNVAGFQLHFKSILVYNLKTKSDFWSNCPHYIMGYIMNWGSRFFYVHWFRIWHISIIHCAKFEVYTCSICDVVSIPTNACSSLFKLFGGCIYFIQNPNFHFQGLRLNFNFLSYPSGYDFSQQVLYVGVNMWYFHPAAGICLCFHYVDNDNDIDNKIILVPRKYTWSTFR